MPNGNGGLLAAAAHHQTMILCGKVAVLGVNGCVCCFDQGGAQPGTPFAGPTTQALACTLIVAWTHACPRSQMPRTGEAPHISANLGEDDFGQSPLNPWNRLQALELCLKGAQTLSNLLA